MISFGSIVHTNFEMLSTVEPAGLQKLGWVEGRNIRIDTRWAAGDTELMQRFAAEALSGDMIGAENYDARQSPYHGSSPRAQVRPRRAVPPSAKGRAVKKFRKDVKLWVMRFPILEDARTGRQNSKRLPPPIVRR